MNNAVLGKTMENVRKHRDIKLVTTGRRRNYLVSQSNYHTVKFFTEYILAIKMKKMQILMNKAVCMNVWVTLVNIHYLLFSKRYKWRIFLIRRCW